MACDPITPARFKELKPQFAAVDDAVITGYITLGGMWVDGSWPDRLCEAAQTAIVCHLMTLDGLGTDAQSQQFKAGLSNFQSFKSGELTLTRFQKSAGETSYSEWLAQTSCGAFFAQLLRMAKGGPRIAMGGVGGAQSGYAKDVANWPVWRTQ
ncbi:DUF4054 domain-containing protein [Falsochrobactrum sp. TDYN1]|uniref:DUF4054 domain-containing protein n=1 Tax=Falsochrobactrum tianjinense TaxID=2706015 RepID=A0A949UTV9_9HYPH|nr:DUF4054 domain-containing protein [Falsochrobactrum sp. TDYN1]MBV2144240.1 DUF4054 domain-containing protein [Falsochrobactrum sp. TDYN1]